MQKHHKFSIWYVLLGVWVVLLVQNYLASTFAIPTIPYSEFLSLLKEDKVAEVAITQNQIQGKFKDGETADSLGLTGKETFTITVNDSLEPMQEVTVKAGDKTFTTVCRIDTPVEVDYYRNGGILHTVLRKLAKA